MAVYRYIRNIQNPEVYLSSGYIDEDHPVPEGFEIVEGYPPEGAIKYKEPDPVEVISEAFQALTKVSRGRMRPYLTQGYIALQVGSELSLKDILEDATAAALTPDEKQFVQTVKEKMRLG